MKSTNYPLSAEDNLKTFEFISEGPNGLIRKMVQFTPTNLQGFYILAFGDKDSKTGELDDLAISNNHDTERILATVAATVYAFTDKYSEAWIYATGSTKARTRLYRMGINKYFSKVRKDFEILGQTEKNWEAYEKDKDYDGFLVRRKKIKTLLR